MSVNHYIDDNDKLIHTSWEGEAIDSDFIRALKKYQTNIQANPDYQDYNEIVDFSGVTNIKLTTEGIISIGQIASGTDSVEKPRKLAIIVSSNLAFGLARIYRAYRNAVMNSSKEINVFKSNNDALDWLQT